MASLFPSLKPSITNKVWFTVDHNNIVESDVELTKQEEEFAKHESDDVNQGKNILPIGKEKEKIEDHGEEEEEEDVEDESNEEMEEEDTDEVDTASNGGMSDSINEEEMF
ncbi:anaphase-promoting complex subunit 15-like [Clytia hemisphaerica]|uniref:anaphase-promoting complex subunit 15-like n=1 Tax=Clytia hemisphaerica TaxID=252671 RepID=UPI0034D72596